MPVFRQLFQTPGPLMSFSDNGVRTVGHMAIFGSAVQSLPGYPFLFASIDSPPIISSVTSSYPSCSQVQVLPPILAVHKFKYFLLS